MTYAVVLGSAQCWAEDMRSARRTLGNPERVYAVNDAGAHYANELFAFVTLHPETLRYWLDERHAAGNPYPLNVWSHENRPGVTGVHAQYIYPGAINSGSSGLYAVKVATEVYREKKIVLCGVPMDTTPRFFGSRHWHESDSFYSAWVAAAERLKHNTRSMGGRTATLLGFPSTTWLNESARDAPPQNPPPVMGI